MSKDDGLGLTIREQAEDSRAERFERHEAQRQAATTAPMHWNPRLFQWYCDAHGESDCPACRQEVGRQTLDERGMVLTTQVETAPTWPTLDNLLDQLDRQPHSAFCQLSYGGPEWLESPCTCGKFNMLLACGRKIPGNIPRGIVEVHEQEVAQQLGRPG